MKNKWRNLALLTAGGVIFGVFFTGIVYYFFPQYLCYAVYDVSENDLYQSEAKEMLPGMQITESFIPQYRYLTGVNIGVQREENDNVVIGRLLNGAGNVLAEGQFALTDVDYGFSFHKWVEPGQQYQLEVLFPEENHSAVLLTFGPGDSGACEHGNSYIDGILSEQLPFIRYIYGTYSRKLLAFWFLVLFLGGFMIGETILYKFTLRERTAQK